MNDFYTIPVTYKEGTYGIQDFNEKPEEGIFFDYDAEYKILEYTIPVGDDIREIRLYEIPKEAFLETLNISYDNSGLLHKITARIQKKEVLLYIRYTDIENARQIIKNFAIQNADSIVEQICTCTDVVARLFIEYFDDGECMDFHAMLGTPAQKEALEKKYPESENIGDNPGDYSSERIYGDNDTLRILITCANTETDLFQYAADIMAERIREKAVDKLKKTDDFQFICLEYD